MLYLERPISDWVPTAPTLGQDSVGVAVLTVRPPVLKVPYVLSEDYRGAAHADCWNWDKWGLKEYKCRGPFLVSSLGSSCWYKRFCSALAALVGPVQFFSSQYTVTNDLTTMITYCASLTQGRNSLSIVRIFAWLDQQPSSLQPHWWWTNKLSSRGQKVTQMF